MIDRLLPNQKSTNSFNYLLILTTIIVFFVVFIGGLVRATNSGGACPDWPTCFGTWTPPSESNAVIDYLHRGFTALAIPLLLLSTFISKKRYGSRSLISKSIYFALVLLFIQVIMGWFISQNIVQMQDQWASAIHLGLSLMVLAGLLAGTVLSFFIKKNNLPITINLAKRDNYFRLALLTTIVIFILLISGIFVTATESGSACTGWPMCGEEISVDNPESLINIAHRFLVLLAGVLLTALTIASWRRASNQSSVLVSITVAFVLYVAQALMGSQMVNGFPIYLIILHQATAVAVWMSLVIGFISIAVLEPGDFITTRIEGEKHAKFRLVKDLLLLTKPIVVALLLVTTFAGMVIGGRAWPDIGLTFWTLLGGFLAAGGSGAINQYIDRYDDNKMQRTQKRPIPAGRLTASQGLAFGVGITLVSFYVMVAFVNLLAALLSLAGIIYYVFIYSIILKKTTVQNIVIGGGAGAIPPLVGWAAVTGSLNIPSLFLFAIVFMWTPPHFWALALVRRKDYARAGVPMLPVVRGERETRWQIFLYTIELVVLTLLLPLFGLGGSIYFIGAVILGAWLLRTAWSVWKGSGNKVAWKMYRYSSMYLAFIFLVLMVDRLV